MGKKSFTFDWLVIIASLLLVCIGLVTLLSINNIYFNQQLIFAIIGIVLFFFFAKLDFSIYRDIDFSLYAVCIVFLLLSFLGPNVRGATRWLELGFIRVQPSELIKPLFLLCFSSLMIRFPPIKMKLILLHTILFCLPFALVLFQPDLGNAIVYLNMWVILMILGGLPLEIIIFGSLSMITGLPLGYSLLKDYQKLRLISFLNPWFDPRGAGYNAIQSMITVGSGQLFGRGFGRGTQSLLKFLPEHHTDFIFGAFVEIFGFMGGFTLLILYFLLLWQILKWSRKKISQNYAYLFLVGMFMQLFTQIVINIGMNIGIVPITGITLPFVSYGGSSLLSSLMSLGIFMSAIQNQKQPDI